MASVQRDQTEEVQLEIAGMTCASCVSHVEKALKTIPGVAAADVNLALENARVRYFGGAARPEDLVRAVSQAGYHVRTESIEFVVDGLEEASVQSRAERAARSASGVVRTAVNAAQGVLTVEWVRGVGSVGAVRQALTLQGFSADVLGDEQHAADPRRREAVGALRRLAFSVLFTVPLWIAMGHMFFGWGAAWWTQPWLEFAAATVVQWGPGYSFTRRAWLSLRHGNANMDVLVATGTLAAWSASVYGIFAHAPLYFDTSATVITLILVGKYLEAYAKGRTTDAIRQLLALTPQTTRLRQTDGTVQEVGVDDVVPGNFLEIRSGDYVPVDGMIVEGLGLIDESMLTGESELAPKAVGSQVAAGTVHRGDRNFVMTAVRIGRDTMLAQIVHAVEEAQSAKAPIQRFVDRVANVFVPIVLFAALATFAATGLVLGDWRVALLRAVAVLVVACPCSLGLATPTAVMVGSGLGARRGVLFRNGEALERLAQVDMVAMDKTGTLTVGRPRVVNVAAAEGGSDNEAMALAAALEGGANHPLAEAFRVGATGLALPTVTDVYVEEGQGLVGEWNSETVVLGNELLMKAYGVEVPDGIRQRADTESGAGRTVIWLGCGKAVLAVFVVADALRPDAPATVAAMRRRGYAVAMLSGDKDATAAFVAAQAGIDDAHGGLSPKDKAAWVSAAEGQGAKVAMVGDGVNDAPALARAYVGMAVASGTDVARETAEVTLMRSDVSAVYEALSIGRQTMGKIRQNLFWALFYNVLMIPLAAFGVLSPMIAGGAMALSSVTVVTNSLLLNLARRERV